MNGRAVGKLENFTPGQRCREELSIPCAVTGEEKLPISGSERALQEISGVADGGMIREAMDLDSSASIAETLPFGIAPMALSAY